MTEVVFQPCGPDTRRELEVFMETATSRRWRHDRATLTTLFEGGNYFECPRWHDGRWWAVGLLPADGLHLRRRRPRGGRARGRGPAVGPRVAARRRPARRVDEGPARAAPRRRRHRHRARRRLGAHHRPPQRHDRRPRGPRLRRQLRLRPHGRRPAGDGVARADRPRRQREHRRRGPVVPQRHGHHRRRHADRRRDVRRALHGVHDRGRRRADRSPDLGAGPADARAAATSRRCSAPSRSRPTAARWTPRGTSGRPTRSPAR